MAKQNDPYSLVRIFYGFNGKKEIMEYLAFVVVTALHPTWFVELYPDHPHIWGSNSSLNNGPNHLDDGSTALHSIVNGSFAPDHVADFAPGLHHQNFIDGKKLYTTKVTCNDHHRFGASERRVPCMYIRMLSSPVADCTIFFNFGPNSETLWNSYTKQLVLASLNARLWPKYSSCSDAMYHEITAWKNNESNILKIHKF